jgi:hypothetical protein
LFPVALQIVMLGALVALAAIGWGLGTDLQARDLAWLRKTNLATSLVWGFWRPGLIVATFLLGRVWCTVCPTELVNRMGDALARRVGWPRLRGPSQPLQAGRAKLSLPAATVRSGTVQRLCALPESQRTPKRVSEVQDSRFVKIHRRHSQISHQCGQGPGLPDAGKSARWPHLE